MIDMPEGWESRGKPASLFRRFDFQRYGQTRDFLDRVAAVSEEVGLHPQNINFGTTYVNVSIEPGAGAELGERERTLALRISAEHAPSTVAQ